MADSSGFKIGTGYVVVEPDTTGFGDKLNAKLDAIKGTVGVTPEVDASAFKAKLQSVIDSAGGDVTIRVDADTEDADAKLDELDSRLDDIGDKDVSARVDADTDEAHAKIDDIDARLDELGDKSVSAKVTLDDGDLAAKAAADEAAIDGLGGSMGKIGGIALGISAALPALPALLGGAAAAGGTLALAFGGVVKAMQASNTASTQTGQSSQQLAQTELSNSIAIVNAKQAVSDAETQEAHDAITSAESIQNAEQSLAQATQQAAQNEIAAKQQLQTADYNEQQAQQALTQAKQQAILTIQQLNDASEDANLSAKQAALDLQQAELNQQQVDKSSTSTALQKAQAELAVEEAEQRLKEAQQNRTNSSNAANKADKDGVNGAPGVLDAKHQLILAEQQQAAASKNVATVEQAGAQAIAKAAQQLADAERSADWQRASDAERVTDAQRNLSNTYKEQSAAALAAAASGTTSASQFAKDMAAMTPAAQAFVMQLKGMEGGYHSLQGAAQAALFPGLTVFLSGIKTLLPEAETEVGKMGTILGGSFANAGKALKTSGVHEEITAILDEGNKLVTILVPAIGTLVKAFAEVGSKAGGEVTGLGTGIASIVTGVANMVKAMSSGTSSLGTVFASAGKIIGALGAPVGLIIDLLAKTLGPVLKSLVPVANLITGAFGQFMTALQPLVPVIEKLAAIFATSLITDLKILMPIITTVATIITDVFAAGLTALMPLLARFGPVILGIVGAIKLWAIAQAALDLVMDANPIGLVVAAIALLVGAIVELIKHWSDVEDAAKSVWSAVADAWNGIYATISSVIGNVVSFLANAWDSIENGVKSAWNDIWNWLSDFWSNTIVGGIESIVGSFKKWLANRWDDIFDDVKSGWDAIWNWLKNFWDNTVVGNIESIVGSFKKWLSNAWGDVLADVKNGWGAIWTWLSNFWNNTVVGGVEGIISTFRKDLSSKWDAIAADAKAGWGKLENIFKAPVNFLINTVYNNGIAKLWNDVVNAVGAKSLDLPVVATLAEGGKLPGYGGGDRNPALLEDGETVVSKEDSRQPFMQQAFQQAGVPGYASGGAVGNPAPGKATAPAAQGAQPASVGSSLWDIAKIVAALATGNIGALTSALDSAVSVGGGATGGMATVMTDVPKTLITDAIKAAGDTILGDAAPKGGGSGSGNDIVSRAASYLGKIPYVFGGTSFTGDDCSGFTQAIYEAFGYGAPRTSEAQGAWVKKTAQPQVGGLAFFNSPAGGPPPGHVGIITGPNGMIDQAGPDGVKGPTRDGLGGAMFFGIPPGGFVSAGGGGNVGGDQAVNKSLGQKMVDAAGWTKQFGSFNSIVMAESDWDRTITNGGRPYAPTGVAYGIPQALPANKMGAAANPPTSSASAQISWMIDYIRGRYGDPDKAWAYHQAHGSYDQGGYLQPGITIAENKTGVPERVLAPGQSSIPGGVNVNFYGTQYPNPEQIAALKSELATAVGVSG